MAATDHETDNCCASVHVLQAVRVQEIYEKYVLPNFTSSKKVEVELGN